MITCEHTVFIVDDDQAVRDSLALLMNSVGLDAELYPSAQLFLDTYDPNRPGCLIADVRMPGMSGLELQQRLVERGIDIPLIIITGHGDVPMAVRAMKAGVVDFIEKPFDDQVLLDRVHSSIKKDAQAREEKNKHATLLARLNALSSREREVMELIVSGKVGKEIAWELGISPKTVDVHRAHLLEKLQVNSIAELVRLAITIGGDQVNEEA